VLIIYCIEASEQGEKVGVSGNYRQLSLILAYFLEFRKNYLEKRGNNQKTTRVRYGFWGSKSPSGV
jgi:hypothetical protein